MFKSIMLLLSLSFIAAVSTPAMAAPVKTVQQCADAHVKDATKERVRITQQQALSSCQCIFNQVKTLNNQFRKGTLNHNQLKPRAVAAAASCEKGANIPEYSSFAKETALDRWEIGDTVDGMESCMRSHTKEGKKQRVTVTESQGTSVCICLFDNGLDLKNKFVNKKITYEQWNTLYRKVAVNCGKAAKSPIDMELALDNGVFS